MFPERKWLCEHSDAAGRCRSTDTSHVWNAAMQSWQSFCGDHARNEVDGCVVDTAPLCGLVEEFVDGWLKTRPSKKGGGFRPFDPSAVDPISPYTRLAIDTGIPEAEIKKVRNPGRHPLTELRVADALVASIGHPGMIGFADDDPLLVIRPNPKAPPARQAECCGGSTAPNGHAPTSRN